MKRIYLALFTAALALGASAHRDVYFVDEPDLESSTHYSIAGGVGEKDGSDFVIEISGDYSHAGATSFLIKHDQRTHGTRVMPNLSRMGLKFICGAPDGGVDRVKPTVVVTTEEGENYTFTFPVAKNTIDETQELVSTSFNCENTKEMGRINEFKIYFDGVEEGDLLVFYRVTMSSDWSMPEVSSTRQAYGKYYWLDGRELEDGSMYPGVTWIQAEDFDESWINGRVAHTRIAGGNHGYGRLYPEDGTVYITTESGSCPSADGSRWGRWEEGHGHTVCWRNNDEFGGGHVIADFIPSGSDANHYYGEYIPGYSEKEPYVTLENAMANFGAWTEYTFDAKENCTIDLSINAGVHRACFDALQGQTPYWWQSTDEHGYVVEGMDDDDYFEVYGYHMIVSLDGQRLRTAWDSEPKWCNDGNEYRRICIDPSRWTNTQQEVNGEMVNSEFLMTYPCPLIGLENIDGDDEAANNSGRMWWTYYKSDMINDLFLAGRITEQVRDKYAHPDYINIPITAGRHTIRVNNLGGQTFFDEIKIEARDGDGIQGVIADDMNTSYTGTPIYFDLQGVRVAHPNEGGLYIVRRGNVVTKEVVRF